MAEMQKGRSGGTMATVWWSFAAVGAFYAATDHPEHVYDYLPYILLMACPLLDIFRRYGGHRRGDLQQPEATRQAVKKSRAA